MTVEACAALVERGDPQRFRAAMTAEAGAARDALMALYAFNLEVARAPCAVSEPMLGEIRLRWWTDALDETFAGLPARGHEVCAPLAAAIRQAALPRAPLQALIEARLWDCARAPFAGMAALEDYLDATAGGLMWLAALALGARAGAEAAVRDLGRAAGAAALLRAARALYALGRAPLPVEADRAAAARGETTPELAAAIRAVAEGGAARLARARAARATAPGFLLPALLPAAGAGGALARAAARPEAVLLGGLERSEMRERAAMLLVALSGRW